MTSRILLVVLTLGLVLAPAALAADVYVVHGIDGTDLGQVQELPVDINVNGRSVLTNVPFGGVAGPLELPEGEHTLEVRLANGAGTGTLAISGRIDLSLFETAVIVAHLDGHGTARLSKFTVNTGVRAEGQARLALAHAAQAPAVDVSVRGTNGTKGKTRVRGLINGQKSFPAELDEGTYRFTVKATGAKGTVAKLDGVEVGGNLVIVAVGSVVTGTFTVIPVAIGG